MPPYSRNVLIVRDAVGDEYRSDTHQGPDLAMTCHRRNRAPILKPPITEYAPDDRPPGFRYPARSADRSSR